MTLYEYLIIAVYVGDRGGTPEQADRLQSVLETLPDPKSAGDAMKQLDRAWDKVILAKWSLGPDVVGADPQEYQTARKTLEAAVVASYSVPPTVSEPFGQIPPHGDPRRHQVEATEARNQHTNDEGLVTMAKQTTIHITIGNSDNKLTQLRWSLYIESVDEVVRYYAKTVHGQWFSAPDSQYQNACWAVVVPKARIEALGQSLVVTAQDFDQDSIAWNQSVTQFIESREK